MEKILMNLKTGERFSADRSDYFMALPETKIGQNLALVERVTMRGKNIVGGHGWKIIKRHPKIKDLERVI
jgi:serine acetyltransferase